jgi:RimJ/RimL family protein N-acetyltransferase
MTKIPLTRRQASADHAEAIRNAVRTAETMPCGARIATQADADALTALLIDPQISDPIYSLPKPLTRDAVSAFIDRHLQEHARGEGVLMVMDDGEKAAAGYYDIQFWPEWAACELGGAVRTNRQGAHTGMDGAVSAFDWLFDEIGVDLICETAARNNIRTAKLLDHIGFRYIGEIESELPNGGVRPSHYWEMTKADRADARK